MRIGVATNHPQTPNNLVGSKWTALQVEKKRRHWEVTAYDSDSGQVTLEAVIDGHHRQIPWRDLRDRERWETGWVSGSETREPTLVLLHGLFGDSRDWEPAEETLASQFQVVAVDLPGHGRKTDALPSGDETADLEFMVQDLDQRVSELGEDSVWMVGYSMGGRVAMAYALRHPETLDGLVLESASPGIQDDAARKERAELDDERAERILENGLEAFLDGWYRAGLFGGLREHPDFDAMLARRLEQDDAAMARVIRQMSPGRQPARWEQLSGLRVPTLWLAGAQDEKYVDIVQRASDRMPSAECAIAKGSGHTVHIERPEWWCDQVTSWVSAAEAASG
jgi:2-succinyl-6-hydroxy-2,4-cyclohexadiene-1-carboxylate synthase